MFEAEKAYYRQTQVRSRLIEYCGGSAPDAHTGTARYLVTNGNITTGLGIPERSHAFGTADLDIVLTRGADIFRSMWDRDHMLFVVDLDYQNPDYPYEALYNPSSTFEKMEPVFTALRQELSARGISHKAIMTGQGYHFVWSIPDSSPVNDRLARIGSMLPTLQEKYRYDHPYTNEPVPTKKGAANAGIGLLFEFLAHRVLGKTSEPGNIPAVATGLPVGVQKQGRGRESASIDLSACGDPLFMRYFRCAFSVYHKAVDPGIHRICLPRDSARWNEMMEPRASLEAAAEYARNHSAAIPEAEAGTGKLLDDYLQSGLRSFHDYFNSGRQDEPGEWENGYDRLDLGQLPPCVSLPLAHPNPDLPKPGNIQNVTRVLVSRGWHPRSVAGLVRSRFERDFNWGVGWLYYDAATRADFYVRMYSGLVATGIDNLSDFNCVSHQEEGLCPQPWCGFNLADYKEPLWKAIHR
jgi:hypothetical protein